MTVGTKVIGAGLGIVGLFTIASGGGALLAGSAAAPALTTLALGGAEAYGGYHLVTK